MISIIKEICIFMIIVQGILCFVPGNSYIKYVRILVGIVMILRIMEPVFGLFTDSEVRNEINWKVKELEKDIALEQQEFEVEGSEMSIYNSIEEELKERLKKCEGDYEVKKVELAGKEKGVDLSGEENIPSGDSLHIIITVSRKDEEKDSAQKAGLEEIKVETVTIGQKKEEKVIQDEGLKQQYSEAIGVSSENIEIIFERG